MNWWIYDLWNFIDLDKFQYIGIYIEIEVLNNIYWEFDYLGYLMIYYRFPIMVLIILELEIYWFIAKWILKVEEENIILLMNYYLLENYKFEKLVIWEFEKKNMIRGFKWIWNRERNKLIQIIIFGILCYWKVWKDLVLMRYSKVVEKKCGKSRVYLIVTNPVGLIGICWLLLIFSVWKLLYLWF